MPIFEYKCKKCGSTFEKIVFGSAERKVECPDCHSRDVAKLFSAFSMRGSTKSAGSSSCSPSGAGFS
ncbi:MAG TPA: zinc ribbon domain-containing protein [Deltaproteobacteria bacterium]|nr:MAG: zinc ribbon domain-containing protein [Deltaproteobacteria bacterium]HEC32239.1 zinc ribbon domain-containing protein [Deltaproteobacteria bacterium]